MIEWSGKRNTEATSSRRRSDSQMRLRHTKQTPPPSPAQLFPSLFTLYSSKAGTNRAGNWGERGRRIDDSTSAVALIRRGLSVIMTARGSGLRRGAFVNGRGPRGRTDGKNGWVDKRTDNGMVGSRKLFSFIRRPESR